MSINQATRTSDDCDELLSRLMDGDLDEFSMNRLLKHVDEQPSLRASWHRYHINREVMQGTARVTGSLSLADRVRDELKQAGLRPNRSQHWIKIVRPFAVAASVAFVGVFLGLQMQQNGSSSAAPTIAASAVPTVRSMPVMPIDSAGLQAIPASFGQAQVMRSPAPVPIESLYQELARQRLELYSNQHATEGALHTPATLMTGTLARAEAQAGKR